MTLNDLLDTVPAYAKDLKLNLSSLLQQQELNEQQIWGTVAVASRNPQVLQTVLAEAAVRLASVIHGLATVFDTEAVSPSQTVPA